MLIKTIFIAGIHGVGKSFLCEALSKELGLPHYGASQLIKAYNNSLVASDKFVKDVSLNQDVLLREFQQLKETGLILLDGHACLLKDGKKIERIPMSTFEGLQICSMILVEAPVEIIIDRLKNRDNILHDITTITKLAETEDQYCEEISEALSIPLITVQSNDIGYTKALVFIKQFF